MQINLILRIVLIYNNVMIICVCKNVNSRQLTECLQRGLSLDDISKEVGLGTGCGKCLEYAVGVVERESNLIMRESAA